MLQFLALAALVTATWHFAANGFTTGRQGLRLPLAIVASSLYLASHVLRSMRLGLLLLFERPAIRMLFAVHFMTSWLSAVIPLKLGEVARVGGLMSLAKQPGIGLAAYGVEKLLDALVLLALVAIVAAAGGAALAHGLLAAVLLLLVVAGGAAYFSARGLIADIRLLLVGDSRSTRSLRALAWMQFLDFARESLRSMMHGRVALLLLLTTIIWALDVAAFMAAAAAAGVTVVLPVDFLQTLQSMLNPSTKLPSAAAYAWMLGACLAFAAIPFSLTIVYLARREKPSKPRWHQSAHHKQYLSGERDASDYR